MTKQRVWLKRYVGTLSMAAALAVAGCDSEADEEACPTYACINDAKLEGRLTVTEAVKVVEAEYCSEAGCVAGTVELEGAETQPACTHDGSEPWGDGICFTRTAPDELELSATLTRTEDGTLPPDGEGYTLRVVDHDSGEVLLDEAREADYEITRQDVCHVCWSADMAL